MSLHRAVSHVTSLTVIVPASMGTEGEPRGIMSEHQFGLFESMCDRSSLSSHVQIHKRRLYNNCRMYRVKFDDLGTENDKDSTSTDCRH
jgi:hypothetical protein